MDEKQQQAPGKKQRVLGRDEWEVARRELLVEEKQVGRQLAELAAKRRALPWLALPDPYEFERAASPGAKVGLAELFGDSDQLIVYHLMMGADAERPCSMCSFFIDQLTSVWPHMGGRAAFAVVAKAPASRLAEVAQAKGWTNVYSTAGTSFNEEFGVSFTAEQLASTEGAPYNYGRTWKYGSEAPGLSVFKKDPDDGTVYHTYSTFAAGLATSPGLSLVHSLLDVTPTGRDEKSKRPMWWVKHKAEY
jgi:predicted dithiol-disulfide oxidoreductase (DUF899 family)